MDSITIVANIFNPEMVPIILGCSCNVHGGDVKIVAGVLHVELKKTEKYKEN